MATYKDIQREIDKLQKLAASTRKAEVKSVIAAIRKQIAEHGLTAEELGFAEGSAPKARVAGKSAASKSPKSVGAPKYQDPKSKKTWTGRGKPPNWIVNAKNRDAFLIKAVPTPAEAATPAAEKPAIKAVKGAKAPSVAAKVPKATKAAKKAPKARVAASKNSKASTPVDTPAA